MYTYIHMCIYIKIYIDIYILVYTHTIHVYYIFTHTYICM